MSVPSSGSAGIGLVEPLDREKTVVLPAPDGPTKAVIPPGGITKLTPGALRELGAIPEPHIAKSTEAGMSRARPVPRVRPGRPGAAFGLFDLGTAAAPAWYWAAALTNC